MKKILTALISVFTLIMISSCSFNSYIYDDHEKFISNSDFVLEEKITEIEVSWINGDINIIQSDTSSTSIKEENYGDYPLYYYVDGTTLKIEFVEHGTKNNIFSELDKELTISLPFDVNKQPSIDIDIVNGSCVFTKTYCDDINVELVNGDISFNSVTANDIEIDMVNGDFIVESISASSLSIEKVNGNSTIKNIETPMNIEIESVNGSDIIYVPSSLGYKVKFDSIGAFSSDYDNLKSYGNEMISINYDATNGTLIIKETPDMI